MIARLPHWILTERKPAVYDSESLTTVEMTAKVYAKMQELVDDYNQYVDTINKAIDDFESGIIKDFECFKEYVTKTIHDYIHMIDEKIKMQDLKIQETVEYFNTNLEEITIEVTERILNEGDVGLTHSYDETTKKVNIYFTEG